MSENLSFESTPAHPSDYSDLLEKSLAFSPSKTLDMEVDVASGDGILTTKVLSEYDGTSISGLIDSWRVYADNADEYASPVEKAKAAVAVNKIAELRLIQSIYAQSIGEIDNSDVIGELEAEAYSHYSEDVYRGALRQKIKELDKLVIFDPSTNAAKADLLDELESLAGSNDGFEALETPEAETLVAVQNWIIARFGPALEHIDSLNKKSFDAREMVDVMNTAVQLEPALAQTNWNAVNVERNKTAVAVSVADKEVRIPTKRTVLAEGMKKLVVHETYGHALRSANAEIAGNEVGRYGTAANAQFEESFQVALEQCSVNKYDATRGVNHYIAVGLAVSDGKSAQEVSRIVESMHQLKKASKSLDDEAVSAARRMTAVQLRRTFAGMTDVDAGIAHRKSIDYLHGLNDSWKLLNHLVKTDSLNEGMNWLESGKFNPFNADDRELANEFHAMPASLAGFFDTQN